MPELNIHWYEWTVGSSFPRAGRGYSQAGRQEWGKEKNWRERATWIIDKLTFTLVNTDVVLSKEKGRREWKTRKEIKSKVSEEVTSWPHFWLLTLLKAWGDAFALLLCELKDSSQEQPEASSTVYVVDGFLIDWLCCRTASASQHQQRRQQQSYWCYWAAVRYNPIYTWHEARLEQITPNPIRWKGAQLTEPVTFMYVHVWLCDCVCVFIHMCACVCTLVGGNIKITISDLQFSSSVKYLISSK